MAVLDDLEQVATVLGAELRHFPVVDDQDGGLGAQGEQLRVASVGALAVDDEPEALLEAEGLDLGRP